MNSKKQGLSIQMPTHIPSSIEHCDCFPISTLQHVLSPEVEDTLDCHKRIVPAAAALNQQLRNSLATLFPRSTPLSVLLLHMSQLEHTLNSPLPNELHGHKRYHAPDDLLEQVMVHVRRAIRSDDMLLTYANVGAALIFPYVDQQGAYSILERIYHQVRLLQAETVIPPLKRETSILLGLGSYPEPGASLEHMLYFAGYAARCLTLRPAISTHPWDASASSILQTTHKFAQRKKDQHDMSGSDSSNVPFMQLPSSLPGRLKQLVPYKIASQLRCVPVGRSHQCLTIAMANPTSASDVQLLTEITGLIIFPVSCDEEGLDSLLEHPW